MWRQLLAGLCLAAVTHATPIIAPDEAASHVGEYVTVEGEVVNATTNSGTCVLEIGSGGVARVRAVLVIPLVTDLPRSPDRLYAGKRVRVSGKLRRFEERFEMVLSSPSLIEVIDVAPESAAAEAPHTAPAAAAPSPPSVAAQVQAPPTPVPAPTSITVPAPVAPPARAPAPTPAAPPAPLAAPAPAVAPTTLPPAPIAAPAPPPTTPSPAPTPVAAAPPAEPAPKRPQGLVEAVLPAIAADPCARAQARWKDAARVASDRADALRRCLAEGTYHCHSQGAALAPALSELEWREQQVSDACP